MPWVEILAAFAVSHLAGDFILQTEWQATHKRGGLGRDPVRRRALRKHVLTYTAAYVPALVWLSGEHGAVTLALTALAIAVPHGVQDDGRLLRAWMGRVKRTADAPGTLAMMVDQSFHAVALLALAVALGG